MKVFPEDFTDKYKDYRSGFITIVGKPNAGKSTLLNSLLGEKISIVTKKPQTTRNRILGVKTLPDAQLIFWDTPGYHKAKKEINRVMIQQVKRTLEEIDEVLMIADVTRPFGNDERELVKLLREVDKPIILALNKIDRIRRDKLLPLIDQYKEILPFKEIVPISALKGTNLWDLEETLKKYLPNQPPLFPEDYLTDVPERFLVAEIIREKIFLLTFKEIPYSTAVVVDEFREDPERDFVYIRATIHVERDSQKKIIIGKNGQLIKKIGQYAREEIEALLGVKVYLELWVKVSPNWTELRRAIKEFGYDQ